MSDTALRGKCALVTGSTAGIGASAAARLAAAGCNIVLNGLGDSGPIEAQRAGLAREHQVEVLYHGADLARPMEIEAMVAAATAAFGSVDILINNAVTRHFAPVHELPPADWDRALAVNVSAPFHTMRLCLPGMRSRGWGRIINLSSVYGMRGTPNRVDYVTSKTALLGMTRVVALENLDYGVTCNAVCPGSTLTESIDARVEALMREERLTRESATARFLAGKNPSGRFVAPASVAALIAFLCSDEAADITGATLPVDGGWAAA